MYISINWPEGAGCGEETGSDDGKFLRLAWVASTHAAEKWREKNTYREGIRNREKPSIERSTWNKVVVQELNGPWKPEALLLYRKPNTEHSDPLTRRSRECHHLIIACEVKRVKKTSRGKRELCRGLNGIHFRHFVSNNKRRFPFLSELKFRSY